MLIINDQSLSITTVSLSRFLLDLREVAYRPDSLSSTEMTSSSVSGHVSSINFSCFVGPLGNIVGTRIPGVNEEGSPEEEIYSTGDINTASSMAGMEIGLEPVRSP